MEAMKAILRIGFLALAVLTLAVPVIAGPYEDGVAAHQSGNYAKALRLWRPLADEGDAKAQNSLGFMYYNSEGVRQDYAEAVRWYRMSAAQGFAEAQAFLGSMYAHGRGVPQDFILAYVWLNLAATSGYERAREFRYAVAKNMTPDQIAEAQRLTLEWIAKHQQPSTVGPSFDCNRARASDEIAICSSNALSEMDNLMAAGFAFVRLKHGKSEANRVGRPLLRSRQACGPDTSCILRRQIEAAQFYQGLGAPIILPGWVRAP